MVNRLRLNMMRSLNGDLPYGVPYRYNNVYSSHGHVPAETGLRALSWYLAIIAVVIEFTVSATLLTDAGSSYVSEGGNFLEKVHPGSYLAILAGSCRIADGLYWPRGSGLPAARDRPLALFLCGIAFCCVYTSACNGLGGVIALVDTFLPAGMLALAFGSLPWQWSRQLRMLIQSLVVMNAIMALGEVVTQCHLVPVSLSGGDTAAEFRPTGLYDHPLTGAAATMIGVFLRPDPGHGPALSLGYAALLIAALIAFGERVPLALTIAALTFCYAARLNRKMLLRILRWRDTVPAIAAMFIGVPVVCVVLAGGVTSRLGAHFYWDASAQVRMSEFAILSRLTPPELVFGCPRAELLALIEPLRLSAGVGALENFWLVMFTTLGLLCFPVFLFSLGGLLTWLWRRSDCRGHMMIVTLIAAASTSNSLGRKSTLLVMLVVSVLATHRAKRVQR
jgi:hypothetical protein